MTTQERLYAAIEKYGLNDERTLKISQERDREIVKEMKDLNKWMQ
ncbi:aspartyl-phosphate phosphatase Spo0E family protein [Clostridium sp. Sa3CUN1]|uniref:Aspartyl-phosphate phosphatase Spo0E family protein n=1 Tax=Clostridium gallinarum TaxID=2762246 RepID=A0ABR8Q266_9CLOT|nr:aspartyl-phosphate phosphatase Spo0E family protein [Clostridium gallinarum]MBD7914518.1 aspartyl-phosphate phosphatase Spo0E family protein [Clostridium gallinarum]